MTQVPNGCCHPPVDHGKHAAHTVAARALEQEAAERVSSWLDANWKYVSDDLARDLRLLVAAASENPTSPGVDSGGASV